MAIIQPTPLPALEDGSILRFQWVLANGDSGAPVFASQWADRSVQVTGTFGAAGNMRWEGTNDADYVALTDGQGNALDFAAAKIEAVAEITYAQRPRVTAGDGTTSLTVTLFARRMQPLRV